MKEVLDFPENLTPRPQYAGFWLRFAAYVIDRAILGLALGVVLGQTKAESREVFQGMLIAFALSEVLYFTALECSDQQATLGKQFVGIKVTDENGQRLTFKRALLRSLSKYFSFILLGAGFIMIFFDKKRQGLHDKVAHTLLVKAAKLK
ncbi:MAG: RDD family protein [Chitinophagales bacterium]